MSKMSDTYSEAELREIKRHRAATKARIRATPHDEADPATTIDPENPPLTDEQLARMRPAHEVLPKKFLEAQRQRREAAEAANDPPLLNKGGRPKLDAPKKAISIRLDPDVIEALRASGAGWQTRANDLLRKGLKLKAARTS